MSTFKRILSLDASYLNQPRDGEILGPASPSNLISLQEQRPKQQHYSQLRANEKKINAQIEEAKAQQLMMLELFQSIENAEKGGIFTASKCHRRCSKDLVVRHCCPHQNCKKFYSAESALQRHIRLKHKTIKVDPPQPYHQLHPQPNLPLIFESSEQSFAEAHLLQDKYQLVGSD